MFLVNPNMIKVDIGTAGLIVVLGMAVVFFGLILLMWVTKISGKIMSSKAQRPHPRSLRLRLPLRRQQSPRPAQPES